MNKNNSLLVGAFVLAALFYACSPAAHIEKSSNVDFSEFKTYAWSVLDSGNKSKYNNSLIEQNVKGVVDNKLKELGWQEVKDDPEVMLSYDVLVQRSKARQSDPIYSRSFSRTFYNPYRRRFYSVYYPSRFLGYDDYNVPVKEGTITITMTDGKTDNTVWQGWSTNKIETARLTGEHVQSSVKAIMSKFDPGTK